MTEHHTHSHHMHPDHSEKDNHDHHHNESHHDHHGHHHHGELSGSKLLITIVLNVVITVSQIIGGLWSGSLALLSDALHNFSDVVALVIVYVANRLTSKPSSASKTYGYKRAEIFAALFNSAVLVGIGVMLIVEAIDRLVHPEVIQGAWVIGLALLSVILNWVSVMLIAKDSAQNSNIRAAYLHLMTDVMTSIGVLVSGVMIVWFQIYWIDALMTMVIAVYLMVAAWRLLKHTSGVLMLFTPHHVDLDKVVECIEQFEAIDNVHHLHIWQLDDHQVHLEAHLDFKEDLTLGQVTQVIQEIEDFLKASCEIDHCNLQAEFNRADDKTLIHQC